MLAPINVNTVPRENYNILWWDKVLGAYGYNIYKSTQMNEGDRTLVKTITTIDSGGLIDTAFLDTTQDEVSVYRVASLDGSMVESVVSERAIAIKTNSIIDNKQESVDRRLFRLGVSRLGEDILA